MSGNPATSRPSRSPSPSAAQRSPGMNKHGIRLTLIGYWRSESAPRWPDPHDFVDPSRDPRERCRCLLPGQRVKSTLGIRWPLLLPSLRGERRKPGTPRRNLSMARRTRTLRPRTLDTPTPRDHRPHPRLARLGRDLGHRRPVVAEPGPTALETIKARLGHLS